MDWIRLVGPEHAVEILGIRLVGINLENAVKLALTLILIFLVVAMSRLLRRVTRLSHRTLHSERVAFWGRQAIRVSMTVILVIGLASIWFDDPTRLTTAMGLVTAGLAFALQRVITALAGYIVILRGETFNVGDRITLGGVRGDVIALGFLHTTIMEMGQPPAVQSADPAMWVRSRQYTGRIVTVTNAKVFDEPVANYTRDFPYIWEEISLPIPYRADRARAEQILLSATERHAVRADDLSRDAILELQRRYFIREPDVRPRVFWRLTDNWLEMTVRFVCLDHGVREMKDAITRELLGELDKAKIEIASTTIEISALPRMRLERVPAGSSEP